ncbi:cell division protein FtsL [Thalassobacillus hwangdonensis]|uniref:Cell division protein FtsL n=1 Tax=Thalassobacillus hwangdonensis TaxID=546108 RepID=A0ABW3KWN9_9BACI
MSLEQVRQYQQHEQMTEPKRQTKVKVHKKRWVSKGEKFLYTIVTGVVAVASVFMINLSSSTDGLNREIQSVEKEIQVQKSQNETLEYQVKELSNPDRILKIAKENGLKIQNAEVKQASTFAN